MKSKKVVKSQVQPAVMLAPALNSSMAICRKDFVRQMSDTDFCETCPLLIQCTNQEEDYGE